MQLMMTAESMVLKRPVFRFTVALIFLLNVHDKLYCILVLQVNKTVEFFASVMLHF